MEVDANTLQLPSDSFRWIYPFFSNCRSCLFTAATDIPAFEASLFLKFVHYITPEGIWYIPLNMTLRDMIIIFIGNFKKEHEVITLADSSNHVRLGNTVPFAKPFPNLQLIDI